MTQAERKKKLLAYDFCLRELILYLDTHPNDRAALNEFAACQRDYEAIKEAFLADGGVWTAAAVSPEKTPFAWSNGPWPWEYKEGN